VSDAARVGYLITFPLTVVQIAVLGSLIQIKMQILVYLARKDTMILWPEQIDPEIPATNVK